MPPSSPAPRPRRRRLAGLSAALLALGVGVLGTVVRHRSTGSPVATVAPASPAGLRIVDTTVLDVITGQRHPHQDVTIAGDRIVAIAAHVEAPTDPTPTIDGRGATLVPGLIDSHCHVMASPAPPGGLHLPDPPANLARLLYAGVTRVFDPGAAPDEIAALRDDVAAGRIDGPTIHAAGPLFTAPGGHPVPMMEALAPPVLSDVVLAGLARQPTSPDEARAQVDALAPLGLGFAKLVVDQLPSSAPRIDAEIARAVVDQARRHGMRPVAHIGTTADALDSADWGVSAWVHGVYKERIPDADIPRLAAADIPMVPTMVVFATYGELARGDFPSTALEREVLPAALLDARADPALAEGQSDEIRAYGQLMHDQRAHALDNVGRLHAAGVTILAGSDAQGGVVQGPALHRELGLLHRAGLSPLAVLQSATVLPARFLSGAHDPDYGIVAAGKRADLLLVEGDPLETPAALAEIRAVIVGGRPVTRTPLAP